MISARKGAFVDSKMLVFYGLVCFFAVSGVVFWVIQIKESSKSTKQTLAVIAAITAAVAAIFF